MLETREAEHVTSHGTVELFNQRDQQSLTIPKIQNAGRLCRCYLSVCLKERLSQTGCLQMCWIQVLELPTISLISLPVEQRTSGRSTYVEGIRLEKVGYLAVQVVGSKYTINRSAVFLSKLIPFARQLIKRKQR